MLHLYFIAFWCPVLSIRNRTLGVYNGDSFVAYIRPSLSPTCDPSQRIKLVEIHHRRLRCTYTEMCKWTRSCCTSQRKETLNDFQLHEVCSFKSKCDFPKHLNRMPVTLKHQVWVLSVQYECTGNTYILVLYNQPNAYLCLQTEKRTLSFSGLWFFKCTYSVNLGYTHAVFAWSILNVSFTWLRTAKAVVRLHVFAGSPEPLLVA